MTTDDIREQAIEQAAKVMLNSPANSVGLLSFTDLAHELADAGLLAGTANTTDAEYNRGYVAAWTHAQRHADVIREREAKLRAQVAALVVKKNDYRDDAIKLRAERDEARREFREARDFGIGIGSEADRARADRAVADLAALRDRVRALADDYERQARAEDYGGELWSTTMGALRALLTDGGDPE